MEHLQRQYPWTKAPLVAGAPMRVIALAPLATEISKAGGLGFVGAGDNVSNLESILEEVKTVQSSEPNLREVKDVLPVGIGFLLWAGDKLLHDALPILEKYKPSAVWLYAPNATDELVRWTQETRRVTREMTKIWIQCGTVEEGTTYAKACQPDVLVVQGQDAGGHGLEKCAGIVPLFPEVDDAVSKLCKEQGIRNPILLAAGGIMDGRTAAAALALGAAGVVMGTRYLASPESNIAKGYSDAVIKASDGGQTTARTKLYDKLRGTMDWPTRYGGRGVVNDSYHDAAKGMEFEENKRLYDEALEKGDEGWGEDARLTTYAGTGVGLARVVMGAAGITQEVREDAKAVLRGTSGRFQGPGSVPRSGSKL